MQKRKFWEVEDDDEALWELVGWDLPGVVKHSGQFAKKRKFTHPDCPRPS